MTVAADEQTRAERTERMVGDAIARGRALDDLRSTLPAARCRDCRGVMFQYRAPITYVLHKCRVCGTWNEVTAAT